MTQSNVCRREVQVSVQNCRFEWIDPSFDSMFAVVNALLFYSMLVKWIRVLMVGNLVSTHNV